jgi:hypothetical protein
MFDRFIKTEELGTSYRLFWGLKNAELLLKRDTLELTGLLITLQKC